MERVLEDLIETVLPLCVSRPTVYNCLAKWARQLEKSADQAHAEKARRLKVPYEPIRRHSYVFVLPQRPLMKTPRERENDVLLLDQMMKAVTTLVCPKVVEKLNELKLELLQELEDLLRDHEDSAMQRATETEQTIIVYQRILPLFKTNPHVFNHIARELQKFSVPLESTWVPETLPTAHDRWMDVRKLDEVLDEGWMERHSQARRALKAFQRRCKAEAKGLQKQEAKRMLQLRATQPLRVYPDPAVY